MLTNSIWEESRKKTINVNLRSKYLIPFIIYIYTQEVIFSNIPNEDLITFSFYCGKFIFPEIKIQVDEEIRRYQIVSSSVFDDNQSLYKKISDLEIEKDELKFSTQVELENIKKNNKEEVDSIKNKLEKREKDFEDLKRDLDNIKSSLNLSSKRKREDDKSEEEKEIKKRKL